MDDEGLRRRLPEVYRLALSLADIGANDELIAECLHVDPAAVPTLIEIGRRKLAELPSAPAQTDHARPDGPERRHHVR